MSHNIKRLKKERGVIKYIFYLFIIIVILSYFGFSIRELFENNTFQSNLSYIWDFVIKVWKEYLKPIYDFLAAWFGPYISDTLERLKNHDDIIVPDVMPKIK